MTVDTLLSLTALGFAAVGAFLGPAGFSLDMASIAQPLRLLVRLMFAYLILCSAIEAAGWIELLTGRGAARPAWMATLTCLIVLALWTATRMAPVRAAPVCAEARARQLALLDGAAKCAVAIGALQIAASFGLDAMQFPRGFEGTAYHLPLAAHVFQSGSLMPWDGLFPHTFPALASALYAVFLPLLPERLIVSTNAPLLILLLLSVYGTALNLGATRSSAAIVATASNSVPLVAFSALEAQADIAGLAFLAAAVFIATGALASRVAIMLLAGALCGLAVASKPLLMIASAGVLAVAIAKARFGPQATDRRVVSLATQGALFITAASVVGGFWFARNWMLFNNPLHPIGFPFLEHWFGWKRPPDVDYADRGFSQFSWVRSPAEWIVYPWVEWDELGQNFKAHSGLGAFVAALVIPAYAFAGIRLATTRLASPVVVATWSAAAFVLVSWWLLNDHQPRYALPTLVFVFPVTAWAFSLTDQRTQARLHWLGAAAIGLMAVVVVSKELVGFADRILVSRMTERHLFYEYPKVVDDLPPGSRILNLAARTWHYPLFGKGLRNQVISTPEAKRHFGLAPDLDPVSAIRLRRDDVKQLRMTHVFTAGTAITTDGCARLTELGRWDRNPVNGVALASPRVLWRIDLCADALQGTAR